MKNRVLMLIGAMVLVQLCLGTYLKFPPTMEQLTIINKLGRSINSVALLVGLRLLTLVILLGSIRTLSGRVEEIYHGGVGVLSALLVIISPLFFCWWYLYPISAIKFVLAFYPFVLFKKHKKLGFLISLVVILCLSLLESNDKAAIFHKFSVSDAAKLTTERFSREDSLADKLTFPLELRRVGYNKVFMIYRQVLGEFIPFFDLETLFFQEVSPTEQKSVVIFYWPEVFLFVWGIYAMTRKKCIGNSDYVLALLLLSFVNYLCTSKQIYLRMGLLIFPIAVIMALGIKKLLVLVKRSVFLARVCFFVIIILVGNGILSNVNDVAIRPDFWFDNRPLVYDFMFKNIQTLNSKKIMVTSKLEGASEYCRYYFGDCTKSFDLSGFDLKNKMADNGTVYAGFVGEFVGSDYGNNMEGNWRNIIISKGLTIVAEKEIRDSVAYGYGNHIVVTIKK
jgi:hypothetical protein